MARILRDEGRLESWQVELVNATFEWLNANLPCPPFHQKLQSGEWSDDATAWFLPDAKEPIQQLWNLTSILEDHGMPVRVIRTESPGLIVYRDEYQVVAETPKGQPYP